LIRSLLPSTQVLAPRVKAALASAWDPASERSTARAAAVLQAPAPSPAPSNHHKLSDGFRLHLRSLPSFPYSPRYPAVASVRCGHQLLGWIGHQLLDWIGCPPEGLRFHYPPLKESWSHPLTRPSYFRPSSGHHGLHSLSPSPPPPPPSLLSSANLAPALAPWLARPPLLSSHPQGVICIAPHLSDSPDPALNCLLLIPALF
jgi:hypothetical protein